MADRRPLSVDGNDGSGDSNLFDLSSPIAQFKNQERIEVTEDGAGEETKIYFDSENNAVIYEARGCFVNTYKMQPDFTAEISDLHLRLKKQSEDNAYLKNLLTEAEEDFDKDLKNQREELDRKSLQLKGLSGKIKRLERELKEKTQQVSSWEDGNAVLCNRITRLEDEYSASQKEKRELYLEIEEVKVECKNGQKLLAKKEKELCQIQAAATSADHQWSEIVKVLTGQVDSLQETVDHLSKRIEDLHSENLDLQSQINLERERGIDHYTSPVSSYLDKFNVMDVSSDDIETDLLIAECHNFDQCFQPGPEALTQRFDVAVQCGSLEEYMVLEQDANVLYGLLTEISEMLHTVLHITLDSGPTGAADDLGEVYQIPNGSGGESDEEMIQKKDTGKPDDTQQGSCNDGNKESKQLSEHSTSVVGFFNQELFDFLEQLKKRQELLSLLRLDTAQSISLTKSCPGLMADPTDTLDKATSSKQKNKSVTCGTQTDSLVVETPILTQKLVLCSASTCVETQHSPHHHHHLSLMMRNDSMTNDTMDNPGFDELCNVGSERVKDDLSMGLKVLEQETDTKAGVMRSATSFDVTEREEPHCSHDNNCHVIVNDNCALGLLQDNNNNDKCLQEEEQLGQRDIDRVILERNEWQAINKLKQGLSVILMILGLVFFLRGFLLSFDDGCVASPFSFKSNGSHFSYCGDLSHDGHPVI